MRPWQFVPHQHPRGPEMPEATSPGPVVVAEGRVQTPLRPPRLCSLISLITSWPSLLWGVPVPTASLPPFEPSAAAMAHLPLRRCPTHSNNGSLRPPQATPQALPTSDFVRAAPSGRNALPAFTTGKIPCSPLNTDPPGLRACAGHLPAHAQSVPPPPGARTCPRPRILAPMTNADVLS